MASSCWYREEKEGFVPGFYTAGIHTCLKVERFEPWPVTVSQELLLELRWEVLLVVQLVPSTVHMRLLDTRFQGFSSSDMWDKLPLEVLLYLVFSWGQEALFIVVKPMAIAAAARSTSLVGGDDAPTLEVYL
ncbi:hypothetical protein GOP47_0019701 [Adiantum capillus-veneris]|uniref:Uncharacterized protein n=1 Tax=Adiantum capillus-veneris TaxID=13818 RepID=A0A9D4Z9V9_ADICA|nr:hypothetical protein GOP47_0019701 [Adiantum capillus-veneris]